MHIPRVGVGLPVIGPHATPDAILQVACAAERLGFHSVSISERLLLPAAPDWQNLAGLPDYPAYDTLEALTWVAAHTRRIRLATGVLISLFQPPIVLARRLATLDHLSGGRLDAGIGQGWLPEEFAAAGVPPSRRGARFEEHLAAMRACWGPDPVQHDGPHYHIPLAKIGPKPAGGRLPVLIGAVTRPAVERAARIGDGFIAAFRDWASVGAQIDWYRGASGAGRIVLRAGPQLPVEGSAAPPADWSEATIRDDLGRAGEMGIDEVIWDLNIIGLSPRRQIEAFEALAPAPAH
jgi:probable F420-dependent oxidoreductase